MADDPQSFAEMALVSIDRLQRQLDVLREHLRVADEYLLATRDGVRPAGEPSEVVVENAHGQTIGVSVGRVGARVTVRVSGRQDGEADRLIAPQRREVFGR